MCKYVREIQRSGLSIYDEVESKDSNLWIPTVELENILNNALLGIKLAGLPLRTRSKKVKESICDALGYPVPRSFRRTEPRFPGQNFDCYIQKSNNLQIWNEEITLTRRYVIVRVGVSDQVTHVRVVNGHDLSSWDKTGTLTKKYQARWTQTLAIPPILLDNDTEVLRLFLLTGNEVTTRSSPKDDPQVHQLFRINEIFDKLLPLIGNSIQYLGSDQERLRAQKLHQLVCTKLGYIKFQDSGEFPDIRHQLLEIKLQTSPTIDLGLNYPSSTEYLNIPTISGQRIRTCDVRYAIFYGVIVERKITLTNLALTTGEMFFHRFEPMQGKVQNTKLQIPIPNDFFEPST